MRPVNEPESAKASVLDFNVENGEHLESDRGARMAVECAPRSVPDVDAYFILAI